MTDYLEELFRSAGVLLEQIKRLEGSAAAPLLEEEETISSPLEAGQSGRRTPLWSTVALEAQPRKEETRSELKPVNDFPDREAAPWPLPREEENSIRGNWEAAHPDTMLPAQEESVPLLEELERLEQAAAALEEGGALRAGGTAPDTGTRRSVYPLALSKEPGGYEAPELELPGGWGRVTSPDNAQASPGGELSVAEQTDQAFRRDSRRYDGGFYLY